VGYTSVVVCDKLRYCYVGPKVNELESEAGTSRCDMSVVC
jgi:hypothetical protein